MLKKLGVASRSQNQTMKSRLEAVLGLQSQMMKSILGAASPQLHQTMMSILEAALL